MAMKSLFKGLSGLALLAFSTNAQAISCAEIMNMVNVNVPTNIVIQTINASGSRFSAEEIQCLADQGAPAELLESAKKMSAHSVSAPAAAAVEAAPPASAFEEAEPILEGDFGSQGEEVEEEGASSPAQIEKLVKLYRANKVLTASKGFYDLLESGEYPEQEAKINYYLAKALYDLGMYHGAQYHFMQVVRKGPKNPYFKYALPKLVAVAKISGNDTELLRIVHRIPPESFPRQAKNHLFYLRGRQLYKEGKLSAAAKYFQQISAKSDLYLRSKYFEGVIHAQREKYKSSVKAFRDVYQAEAPAVNERQLQEMENLKDLALLNIGRTYYGLSRYENANEYYKLVDRSSGVWPESVFERAWSEFMLSDLNESLGLLLTLKSQHYAQTEFIPEATILRSLSFFNFCEWEATDKTLKEFESAYQPMRTELKAFLNQYSTAEGKKLSDQAFDHYFTDEHASSKLSSNVFTRALRNRDLASLIRHMDMMDEELQLIAAQKGVWKNSVGSHLQKVIETDRLRYKKRAGRLLLQELSVQYKMLNNLNSQSEIIRFEVVDAQRVDYSYKASQPQVESLNDKKLDFAVRTDVIYWPFNGEFWQDELGYYRYTEKSSCN